MTDLDPFLDSDDDTRRALNRARAAMDHAILRDTYETQTSLTALSRAGRGVGYDPACHPGPVQLTYSKQAAHAINPKSERLTK